MTTSRRSARDLNSSTAGEIARDRIVLSYGDYLIRSTDMDILQSNAWINDTLIGFYFEYLSTKRHTEPSGFKFFGPEVTQCIKLGSLDDMSLFLGPSAALSAINFMFWPVNDSSNPNDHFGGTHWSLLVYSRRENIFAHFDSTMNDRAGNDKHARMLYDKMVPFVSHAAGYRNVSCETQRNGYDCGVHVLCNAEILADYASKNGRIVRGPSASSEDVTRMRNKVATLIGGLALASRRRRPV